MKKIIFSALILLASILAAAQTPDKLKADKDAILAMCGCYKVEFRYAEVFAPDTAYKFHNREYTWAYEWVNAVESSDKKVVLQHMLVVDDSNVVKHWRQDWLFENTAAHLFNKDYNWQFTQWKAKDVKGQWTQRVYQVDDSPRYTGTGTWIHADGKHFWESTASSPLPRRELTAKRTDYNVLIRGNRQELTAYGWMHRQDNHKVMRTNGIDKLIAVETGYNTYTKVAETKCALAKKEWDATARYWSVVRKVWDRVESEGIDMTLKMMVDGELLYEKMFDLAEKSSTMTETALEKEISAIIKAHTVTAGGDTGYIKE